MPIAPQKWYYFGYTFKQWRWEIRFNHLGFYLLTPLFGLFYQNSHPYNMGYKLKRFSISFLLKNPIQEGELLYKYNF